MAFVDYDRDGWLDLVVCNYVNYNPAIVCKKRGNKPDFCGPNGFGGTASRLYRNRAAAGATGPRFEDVTVKAGLGAALGKGLGVVCADFNGDCWPDLLIANDLMANFLWINRGDGTFREEALSRGVAYMGDGRAGANMGIAWGDADGDGLFDLFVTHISDEMHTLWRQSPRGAFQDRTVGAGLSQGRRTTGFGAAFVDFDRDGQLDLVWLNGGVYRNAGAEPDGPFWPQYAQRHQLYSGEGGESSATAPRSSGRSAPCRWSGAG